MTDAENHLQTMSQGLPIAMHHAGLIHVIPRIRVWKDTPPHRDVVVTTPRTVTRLRALYMTGADDVLGACIWSYAQRFPAR